MRLSISNIGWIAEQDVEVFALMAKHGYSGLEIAPTRVFPEEPYSRVDEARSWRKKLMMERALVVPSMQSIWFGRQERIFGSEEEREILIDYTKKAIDFAVAIGCNNLVFGCPRNRFLPEDSNSEIAIPFFKTIGEYAADQGTIIGMEANPPIYNTNYVNDTRAALDLVREVDSDGFLLNLDIGTMIYNQEEAIDLIGNVKWINHVHISEPGLKPITERQLHNEVFKVLENESYQGFISIEMGKVETVSEIESKLQYVKSIFG